MVDNLLEIATFVTPISALEARPRRAWLTRTSMPSSFDSSISLRANDIIHLCSLHFLDVLDI